MAAAATAPNGRLASPHLPLPPFLHLPAPAPLRSPQPSSPASSRPRSLPSSPPAARPLTASIAAVTRHPNGSASRRSARARACPSPPAHPLSLRRRRCACARGGCRLSPEGKKGDGDSRDRSCGVAEGEEVFSSKKRSFWPHEAHICG